MIKTHMDEQRAQELFSWTILSYTKWHAFAKNMSKKLLTNNNSWQKLKLFHLTMEGKGYNHFTVMHKLSI